MPNMLDPEVIAAMATLRKHGIPFKVEETFPEGMYRCSTCEGIFSSQHYCAGKRSAQSSNVYNLSKP